MKKFGKGKRSDPRNGVKREKYNIPDDLDLELRNKKVSELSKSLLEGNIAKPLTDNQIKALFRDSVRRKWMYSKVKLSFLESMAEPDYDPETRRLWKWRCNICGEYFNKDEVEVDHRDTGGDRDFESMCDAPEYAKGILNVGWNDLQILCADKEKGCHPIKSHSEKFNMSFEEARLDKIAIRWEKQNKGVKTKRDLLENLGVENAQSLKADEIRQAYIDYLKENKNG